MEGTAIWNRIKTDKTHYVYICSRCGHKNRYTMTIYCPTCGRRMKHE